MKSFHRKLRLRAPRAALVLASIAVFAASCSDDTKPRGQLMLGISSDLSIAKDMNRVGVQVFDADGNILSGQDLDILPTGEVALPGTLAVVPPNAGGQTVRIVVTAKHATGDSETTRIVRKAIVKVPTDRVALLRMPLHWLCDDKTDCADDQTCKGGECQTAITDANDLPDYTPAQVFGGGEPDGTGSYCLDAQGCFAKTALLNPDKDDCTVPLPTNADPASLNVALVLPPQTDGHCLDGEDGTCYMPLDSDPLEGFSIVGRRIQLPAAACKRQSVVGVAVSTRCRTKDLSVPICGPWTGWPAPPDMTADAGAGAGAGGAPETSGGGGSGGKTSSTGGMSVVDGEAGAASASCPVTAELAPAYYYVLVDTSAPMQTALPNVRQALAQFGNAAASSGVNFGLQIAQAVCLGDYSKPLLDFTPLPGAVSKLPQQFTAGAQARVQLDDALIQTVDTLIAVPGPASRTLVVFTTGLDQSCSTLTDVMRQALSKGLTNGVSVRPVQVLGTQPNLAAGLTSPGSPPLVTVAAANLQAMTSDLNAFRDAVAPCTYVAPSAASYSVQVASADGGSTTFLSLVTGSSACGTSNAYFKSGDTFTLCPTACTGKGTREVVTDACELTGPTNPGSGSGGSAAQGGAAAGGAAAGGATSATAGATNGPVSFDQVKAIFASSCGVGTCHDSASGQLNYQTPQAGLYSVLTTAIPNGVQHCNGTVPVTPNNPVASLVGRLISGSSTCTTNGKTETIPRMPENCSTTGTNPRACLTTPQISTINQWIANGATQ